MLRPNWLGKNSQAARAQNDPHLLCGDRWGTFGTMSTTVACAFMEERRACTPQQSASSTARRNLFGPVDHEQTRRMLNREMARITRKDTKRWNFNFQSEKPLTGRYDWTPVPENASDTTRDTTPPAPASSPTSSKTQTTITGKLKFHLDFYLFH
uniref:Cyclin-dependent kinase inhibitor domain-containing protein n=1 Tax=Strigamia maritima TaxID=126957 RepID=T1JB93_STRMM